MHSRKEIDLSLYVVTDSRSSNGISDVDVAKLAYDGGADAVQLRVKDGNPFFPQWAEEIAEYAKAIGRIFIVNDSVEIAMKSGADGVHLGQSDDSASDVRKLTGDGFIIGVSVGSVAEAVAAEADGATYVALSPVFDTKTKADAGSGHGLDVLREIKDNVSIPVLAIGGINRDNVCDVIRAGADGVGVVSAVVSQPDIASAASEMKILIDRTKLRRIDVKALRVRRLFYPLPIRGRARCPDK